MSSKFSLKSFFSKQTTANEAKPFDPNTEVSPKFIDKGISYTSISRDKNVIILGGGGSDSGTNLAHHKPPPKTEPKTSDACYDQTQMC